LSQSDPSVLDLRLRSIYKQSSAKTAVSFYDNIIVHFRLDAIPNKYLMIMTGHSDWRSNVA
jgi:hypothetical protein